MSTRPGKLLRRLLAAAISAASRSSVTIEFRPFPSLHFEEHGCYHKWNRSFARVFADIYRKALTLALRGFAAMVCVATAAACGPVDSHPANLDR